MKNTIIFLTIFLYGFSMADANFGYAYCFEAGNSNSCQIFTLSDEYNYLSDQDIELLIELQLSFWSIDPTINILK